MSIKLVYPSYAARELIKNEDAYRTWLKALKPGDTVVRQQFHRANDSILSFQLECWEFEAFELSHDKRTIICPGEHHPVNIEKGWCVYWGSDNPWGDVFPARLVPLHPEMGVAKPGDRAISLRPIYEPEYLPGLRIVYFVPHGKGFHEARYAAGKVYSRHYYKEVDGGELVHCFASGKQVFEDPPEVEGARLAYTESIDW